ncbi:MAG: hypothetical protein Q8922_15195, partial [Bacteroidota bacterium]|nr:hypothetical protein [Bacteroidota bacterium]
MRTSTRKTIAWIVMAFIVSLWTFIMFFFDGILSRIAQQKLADDVRTAWHGEYRLHFARFDYHQGDLLAAGVDFARAGYLPGERGTTVRRITIDSVLVTGISWWDILFGKPITFSTVRTWDPKIALCDAARERALTKMVLPDTARPSSSSSQSNLSISAKT